MVRLNAAQLRLGKGTKAKDKIKKHNIYIVLDNILDTYNIGSIFRLADATASKKIILCGGSETPPNHRIKKSSINTTEIVDWEYFENTAEAIEHLKKTVNGIQIVAVEQSQGSLPYTEFAYKQPIALVVGHETHGVSKKVLELCDGIVEIPMFGVNISLNVMVSLAIVLYEVIGRGNLN